MNYSLFTPNKSGFSRLIAFEGREHVVRAACAGIIEAAQRAGVQVFVGSTLNKVAGCEITQDHESIRRVRRAITPTSVMVKGVGA